jgi:transposase-like protein
MLSSLPRRGGWAFSPSRINLPQKRCRVSLRSVLFDEVDERATTFPDRLIEGDWPYLWIDASYVRVRQNVRIVSVATNHRRGRQQCGRRELLGPDIGASETEIFWTEFLRSCGGAGYAASSWSRMPRRHQGP